MYPSPSPSERQADFLIHAISLAGLLVASLFLARLTIERADPILIFATWLYAMTALGSIAVSFAYHLHPRHEWRSILRRLDHAAIYMVMAGTFSPLLITAGTQSAYAILAAIWFFAIVGVLFKLIAPSLDTRWSLISYLGLGLFALTALPDFWYRLPILVSICVAAGAGFYMLGTAFYRRKGMRFRYPIWHGIGSLGGVSFFVAIWNAVSS